MREWREEINPNKPDDSGRTPLSYAAREGREGLVKILLQRDDVHPDKPENHRSTPLSLAAECGHEYVVKILFGSKRSIPRIMIMMARHRSHVLRSVGLREW